MHTIRKATITDLPAIRYLWSLYAVGTTYPEDQVEDIDVFTRGLAAAMTDPADVVHIFLAEADGQVVSFLMTEIQRRLIGRPHRYGFCSYLYTLPEYRRHGIAMDLFEVAITFAMSRGIQHIELNATPDDQWHLPMGQAVNWTPPIDSVEAHSPFAHTTVAVRQATTCTRVLGWLDRMRGRESRSNGLDQDIVVADLGDTPAPTEQPKEE